MANHNLPNVRTAEEILDPPSIDRRKRLFMKAGGAMLATLSTGMLSACGGGNSNANAQCQPLYDEDGNWISDTCSIGGGGEAPRTVAAVQGRQIFLNGERFMGKGFCYSPLPIGADFKWSPYGDFFTPFWKDIYSRDLQRMREMGVNTIRVYTTSPFAEPWNPASAKQSHTSFLDLCYENGIYVWVTHPIAAGAFRDPNPKVKEAIAIGVEQLCKDVKDHPAVIGFVIGNEINNGTDRQDPKWWAWLNELGTIAKSIAPDKLTMACFVDDAMDTVRFAHSAGGGVPMLDVFGINSYRGTRTMGFDNLFSTFADATTRPLMITEFGCPASTRDANGKAVEMPDRAQAQADYLVSHWKDIVAHGDICAGGYVFAWSDEWWKAEGSPAVHDSTPAPNAAFPGGWGDEEWFGIHSIAVGGGRDPANPVNSAGRHIPDVLTPRAAYEALGALWKV